MTLLQDIHLLCDSFDKKLIFCVVYTVYNMLFVFLQITLISTMLGNDTMKFEDWHISEMSSYVLDYYKQNFKTYVNIL